MCIGSFESTTSHVNISNTTNKLHSRSDTNIYRQWNDCHIQNSLLSFLFLDNKEMIVIYKTLSSPSFFWITIPSFRSSPLCVSFHFMISHPILWFLISHAFITPLLDLLICLLLKEFSNINFLTKPCEYLESHNRKQDVLQRAWFKSF